MKKYGIFLLIIHALTFISLAWGGILELPNDDSWGWFLLALIPFLTLIYIWVTFPSENVGLLNFWTREFWARFRAGSDAKFKLGNLKTEKETLETIKSIKELRKELGEE
jgi:hypothetical protein